MTIAKQLSAAFIKALVDAFDLDDVSVLADSPITWLCAHQAFFEDVNPSTMWTPNLVTSKKVSRLLSRKLLAAVFEARKQANVNAKRPDMSAITVKMQSTFARLASTSTLAFLERCACVYPSDKKKDLRFGVRLSPEFLSKAKELFAASHGVGRALSRQVTKSWTYLQKGWCDHARVAVAEAAERRFGITQSALHIPQESAEACFRIDRDKVVRLRLPPHFESMVGDVAVLDEGKGTDELYAPVLVPPTAASPRPKTPSLSVKGRNAAVAKCLRAEGIDEEVITFVHDISRLIGPDVGLVAALKRWLEVLQEFSSEWTTPCKWWRFARMLATGKINCMVRRYDCVSAPATRIENWDLLGTINLLQSQVFPKRVREAADSVNCGPRRAMAHEWLDCDWDREWRCFEELLTALGCDTEAAKLRKHCEKKWYGPPVLVRNRDKLDDLRQV